MSIRSIVVVEPPERVVTAAEARAARVFTADDDTKYIDGLLEVAQSEIDGPDGWLGRCIGEQVLQITLPASVEVSKGCLPYRPVTAIVSNVLSDDGQSRVVTYRGGQSADEVPHRIKHAIILMAGVLRDATPSEGGLIKRETVDGVGSADYALPDGAAAAMKTAAERLLSTYQVYA